MASANTWYVEQLRVLRTEGMTKRKGLVLYKGPSVLNGEPIVVIATELQTARRHATTGVNTKTGAMVQVYILAGGRDPVRAHRSGADAAVCGDCIHRQGSCYVRFDQGALQVWRAYQRGRYRHANLQVARAALAGLPSDWVHTEIRPRCQPSFGRRCSGSRPCIRGTRTNGGPATRRCGSGAWPAAIRQMRRRRRARRAGARSQSCQLVWTADLTGQYCVRRVSRRVGCCIALIAGPAMAWPADGQHMSGFRCMVYSTNKRALKQLDYDWRCTVNMYRLMNYRHVVFLPRVQMRCHSVSPGAPRRILSLSYQGGFTAAAVKNCGR